MSTHVGVVDDAPPPYTAQEPVRTVAVYGEQYPNANLTLVSSDHVHFKVHRHLLVASGMVFRTKIRPGVTSFHFHDPILSTSSVLTQFLQLLYHGTLTLPSITIAIITTVHLIEFMQKYEITALLRQLEHLLLTSAPKPTNCPLQVFILAAKLDRFDICAIAMRRTKRYRWNVGNDEDKPDCGVAEASVFDFTALPLCLVEVISPRYLWGAMRACRVRPDQSCDGEGGDAAAERFLRIMGGVRIRRYMSDGRLESG